MTRRAVIALGIGQCVNWGVLYYAFAVLVLPLQRELGVSTWVVTGAFSLALFTAAAIGPRVGEWADRGRGALVMQWGGFAAAAILAAWTMAPGVVPLYAVWAALGLCMAATLYEPAFVVIARAHPDPARQLRALALVTLLGGLASTLFLPLGALLLAAVGWRGAVLVLAALLAASASATAAFVRRGAPAAAPRPVREDTAGSVPGGGARPAGVPFIAAAFALASLSSAAFTANLVPALGEQGIAPATAAMLGASMGVMQLPGRALLMNADFAVSPPRLLAASLVLQAAGLGGVALAPSVAVAALGVLLFALGSGLTTVVRPYLVQALFGPARGGYLNGRIARHQHLARAAGPLAVASAAGLVGYATVFAALAAAFTVVALASHGVLDGVHGLVIEKETV